ncbi:MAG: DNA-binding protein [Devosia sp.]|nr:DNA-binding protein [Devosia sp.]
MPEKNVPANQNIPVEQGTAPDRVAGNENDPSFAEDLLRGAEEIAAFLYNDASLRRRVYHLIANSNLPTFKLGSMLHARKSILLRWVEAQENRRA